MSRTSLRGWLPQAAAIDVQIQAAAAAWGAERLGLLPGRWSANVGIEFARRGGHAVRDACQWLLDVTEPGRGRVKLSANDDDLRAAAIEAAADCRSMAQVVAVRPVGAVVALMGRACRLWGVEPPKVAEGGDLLPAVARMGCRRWWLRRLRRAHGLAAEGAAIRAGVVRRGLWPYVSQDGLERRQGQKRRNAAAIEKAVLECAQSGEVLPLADVVASSMANPEIKRSELMVRIRGCDAIAHDEGLAVEFWTLTAPSRFHAFTSVGGKRGKAAQNPNYEGATPKEAQAYICSVWAKARAAWARRGLSVYGLRTAEPHHDGCPHWHLIAYGQRDDLRLARWILRRYALRDNGWEPGARKHRMVVLPAKAGRYGAAYAAKYISKNINGEGMGKAGDGEAGRKVSDSVKRVDAWAAAWGIRQFQFFGCPKVGIWRVLRRFRAPVAVRGSMLERARSAANDSDFGEFWRCAVRGGLELVRRLADRLTQYGDEAGKRVVGVMEGARRAILPVKEWLIHWSGAGTGARVGVGVGVGFDFPWSGINNCTVEGLKAGAG